MCGATHKTPHECTVVRMPYTHKKTFTQNKIHTAQITLALHKAHIRHTAHTWHKVLTAAHTQHAHTTLTLTHILLKHTHAHKAYTPNTCTHSARIFARLMLQIGLLLAWKSFFRWAFAPSQY